VFYENKYSFLNCIFFLLILNINSKVEVFLFNNSKFQDNTNENDLNDIDSFLFNNNEHDSN